jgi:hypothetical protein
MEVQTHRYLKLASLVILLLLVAFAIVATILIVMHSALMIPIDKMLTHLIIAYARPSP